MQGCDMEYRSPGIPAGRSGTEQWRNNVRRAGLRAGCLLGAVGLFAVFSIILSVSLAPVDTAGILMPTARAAGIGQGDNGGRNEDDNGQGSAGDPSGDDPGDDGQGNNEDDGGVGANGAGVTTEGRGQAGGARANSGSHGGERGGARSKRGGARGVRDGHGVAESRPDFGKLRGIVDDDFEDRVAAGSAEAVREAVHAIVLSADEEAAAIAAGWLPTD